MATPQEGFPAVTKWHGDVEEIACGLMIRDGETANLTSGTRRVERDPAQDWVTRIATEGRDEQGRTLEATGTRLIEWSINGHAGHGEDQDMWPIHDWAAMRRAGGASAAA